MKEVSAVEFQAIHCSAIALVVLAPLGGCDLFAFLQAMMTMLAIHQQGPRWRMWKTPILIMYCFTLVVSLATLAILVYNLVINFILYFDHELSRQDLITYTVFIVLMLGIVIAKLAIACKTYNSFMLAYEPNLVLPPIFNAPQVGIAQAGYAPVVAQYPHQQYYPPEYRIAPPLSVIPAPPPQGQIEPKREPQPPAKDNEAKPRDEL